MWPRLLVVGVVAVAVVAPAIVGQFAISRGDYHAYKNDLAACERGNAVRSVVYTNTRNAVVQSRHQNDNPTVTAIFAENLETLRGVPGTDPQTGEVDCAAVIEAP